MPTAKKKTAKKESGSSAVLKKQIAELKAEVSILERAATSMSQKLAWHERRLGKQ